MKSLTLRILLILGLATSAIADNPIPKESEAVQAKQSTSGASTDAGNLEELADRLRALTEPLEQKIEDCDGEVAKAKELLAGFEKELVNETILARKTHKEILLLKDSLKNQGCKISLGGLTFQREVVADGLEKRLNQYKQSVASVKELRVNVASQKEAVQALLAKLERWQAKEKELLQSVDSLQETHDELFGEENTEKLEKATRVEAEVESMLGIKEAHDEKQSIGEIDSQNGGELPPETSEKEESTEGSEAIKNNSGENVSDKAISNSPKVETQPENAVDVEVETELEVDAEIDLEVLSEVFEKS